MTKTIKRPISFLSTVVMFMVMLLYFPSGTFSKIDFGLKASAETITPSQPTGTGTSSDPYQIGTAAELYWFANHVNSGNPSANAVLTEDINLSGIDNWTPIGNESNKYTGTFDGQNHTIEDMSITKQGNNSGLFGYADNATIKNIIITGNITITAESYTEGYGSIVGRAENTTVTNCHSSVNITIYSTMDSTTECIGHIGGIVGKMHEANSAVSNCSYSGTIELNNKFVKVAAGIVGYAINSPVPITNCSFTGKINSAYTGATIIGGIFGYTRTGGDVQVTNCLSVGTIENSGDKSLTGILIGQITNGYGYNAVKNNYISSSSLNVIGSTKDTPSTTPATLCIEDQLASGEVAYLLNNSTSDGTLAWGQEIGKDSYPVLGGATVYYESNSYSNYEPATLTTDKYDINNDGTNDTVYEISNAGQLYWFANYVNNGNTSANAVLTADITVNSNLLTSLQFDAIGAVTNGDSFTSWTPIGNKSNNYTGTFDGQNHTISGLYFNDTSKDFVGLFGYNNGTIKNVGVVDSYFKGDYYVGGVCGYNKASSGTATATIESCYNEGTVSGGDRVGGVCGDNYAYVDSSSGTATATIESCYNEGTVSGDDKVGGVCGYNEAYVLSSSSSSSSGTATATIENCYNTGSVSGSSRVGGVCGYNYNSTIANCYYLDGCNANGTTFTCNNGTSKTKTQFNSGEVAYLLQGEQTVAVWGQTLSGDDKQDYPVLGSTKKVYQNVTYTGCEGNPGEPTYSYANTKADPVYKAHDYSNIFCKFCGNFQPATLTTNKYDINNDGNKESVYEISNASQLYWFADKVNNENATYGSANAVLTEDITVNSNLLSSLQFDATGAVTNGDSFTSWTPIGNDSNKYTGTFDGQNYTISGLYFNNSSTNYVGLFGCNSGTVKNVGVIDSYFKGYYYVGGVCGYNKASSSSGTATATIANCYNTGSVNGTQYVGGVCGYNEAYASSSSSGTATIKNCYNTGSVSGSRDYVGGVCGFNYAYTSTYSYGTATATIANCYNTGSVSGSSGSWYVGGVCGDNKAVASYSSGTATATAIIENCYNTGSVSGNSRVGGVCGDNYAYASSSSGTATATIENCYYNSDVYTRSAVGYNESGTVSDNVLGKTTAQFNSGEVAYLLQGEQTQAVWGQTLSGDDKQDYPVLDSTKKVYQNVTYTGCEGNPGEPTYSYSNTKADPIYGEHKYLSGGICQYCDALQNGKDGFKSASLTLTDGVIINYYVILSSDALSDTNAYIHFTSEQGLDKKIMLSKGVKDNDGKYKFSLELRPDQMSEEITAKVVYSDSSEGSSVKYSVQKYAENQSDTIDTNTSDLINAMLYYGAATQNYTGNNTDNLANKNVNAIFDSNVTISDDYKMSLSGTVNGIKVKGASLIAGSLTTIRVKYEVTEGSIDDFTFTCDGAELTPVQEGNYYYVYIRNINPNDIDKMYSIVVTDKDNNSRTLKYSALTYAKSIIEAEEGKYPSTLVDMMKALYYYNKAADAYVNE